MADVDPTLEQQVLDVPQRQLEPHLHHDHQADHLGRGVEVAERTGGFCGGAAWRGSHCHRPMPPVGSIALTEPKLLVGMQPDLKQLTLPTLIQQIPKLKEQIT